MTASMALSAVRRKVCRSYCKRFPNLQHSPDSLEYLPYFSLWRRKCFLPTKGIRSYCSGEDSVNSRCGSAVDNAWGLDAGKHSSKQRNRQEVSDLMKVILTSMHATKREKCEGKSIDERYCSGPITLDDYGTDAGSTGTERPSVNSFQAVDQFHVGGQLATETLLSYLNLFEGASLLDVGCGKGNN